MKLNQKLARLLRKLAYKLDPIHGGTFSVPIQLDASLYDIDTITCCQTLKANEIRTFLPIAKRSMRSRLANQLATIYGAYIEITSTPLYDGDILLTAKLRVLKPKGGEK